MTGDNQFENLTPQYS